MSVDIGKVLQQYLSRCKPSYLVDSVFTDRKLFQKFYPLILQQAWKWFAGKLNPFKLCPDSLAFWFLVPPFSAIGVTVTKLQTIQIFWRQQMEPNQTIYLEFKVTEVKSPFALTLLVMFASLSLVIADAAYRVFETIGGEQERRLSKIEQSIDGLSDKPVDLEKAIIKEAANDRRKSLLKFLDPFNLTPRMSVFFPIYDHHTSVGFLTIDFRHIEFSIKQSLDPSDNIVSLIRFMDLYTPFSLQIAIMIISTGLFVNGAVYKLEQEKRGEIIRELQRALNSK